MDHLLSKGKDAGREALRRYALKNNRNPRGYIDKVRYLPSFERPGASQPPLFENRILQNMFFLSSSRAEPEITGSIARNDAN